MPFFIEKKPLFVRMSTFWSDHMKYQLNSITEKYENVWSDEHCIRAINQSLDKMRDEVLMATGKVKEYTNSCMSKISENLCQ